MNLELAAFLLSLFFLAIASYTDLMKRIVPDKVSYSMVATGLLLHLAFAVSTSNFSIFFYSIGAAAATFILGYALWKLGAWAGGDVKLFTGMAALNPVNPNILSLLGIIKAGIFSTLPLPIFPLTLFMFSIFLTAPAAVIVGVKKILEKGISAEKIFRNKKELLLEAGAWGAFLAAARALMPQGNIMFSAAAVIAFALLGARMKTILSAILFATAAFFSPAQTVSLAAVLTVFFIFLSGTMRAYGKAKKLLQEKKSMGELEEGMIVAETIAEKNNRIERIQPLSFSAVLGLLKQGKQKELIELVWPKGRAIVSHRRARGLTQEEIIELKDLVRNKKLENHIMVKQSVAFVPSVLLAYCALNIVGDVLWNIVL